MEDRKVIMVCGHCGNRTAFEVEGGFDGERLWNDGNTKYNASYRLLRCITCSYPTLMLDDGIYGLEILYPAAKHDLTHIPLVIQKEYEATLKVRNISSNACAVLARRTLEAIFVHEKAEGRTLADKVNDLIKSDRIPPLVADLANLGRQIGNLGAHFDKEEVTEADVTAMIDFLETILEYLYVLPAKVATVKTRLTRNS